MLFMKQAVAAGKPFFAYIGTTGPHLPSIPAPWHAATVRNMTANGVRAPRTPGFNQHQPSNHPTIAALPEIDPDKVAFVDQHYRLGVLLSVDDLVAEIVSGLDELGVLQNTFILFSSDHGYHMGQWRLPLEKMWPFETDQRIPFYVRGPGITPGTSLDVLGVNMDIAPTLLDLAGILKPAGYDGKSLMPMLVGDTASKASARAAWRTKTVISFAEGYDQWWGSVKLSSMGSESMLPPFPPPQETMNPLNMSDSGVRYSFDNPHNQFRMLRIANFTHNMSFVQWDPEFLFDKIAFSALWNNTEDPWQQHNLWSATPEAARSAYIAELEKEFACKGSSCS